MCELLGLSANCKTTIVRSFTALAERGGNSGPHKDGWGITFYEGSQGCRTFKDIHPSCCSAVSDFVQTHAIASELVIAHIRQANRGNVTTENTHPFTREMWGRCWTMAHNGQLNKGIKLKLGDFQPMGETDSELAFCWILSEIKKMYPHPPTDTRTLFDFIAKKATYLNTKGVFNMLLTDGEYLFAFCGKNLAWLKRESPFGRVEYSEGKGLHDLSEVYDEGDVVTLVATEPLTDELWNKLSVNEYALFKNGQCESCDFV